MAAYESFLLYVALLAVLGTGNREAGHFGRSRRWPALVSPPRARAARWWPPSAYPTGGAPVAVPFSAGSHNSSDVTALTGIDGFTLIEPSNEDRRGWYGRTRRGGAAAPAEGDPLSSSTCSAAKQPGNAYEQGVRKCRVHKTSEPTTLSPSAPAPTPGAAVLPEYVFANLGIVVLAGGSPPHGCR